MLKIEWLNLSFGSVIFRYYLMMAVVLIGGFTGYWGFALLAIPIFLSAILGLKIQYLPKENSKRIKQLPINKKQQVA